MTADEANPAELILPGRLILLGITKSLGSRLLTFALQFATLVALARALGPAGLGVAQFFFVVFTYLILFNDLGLTVLGSREEGRLSSRLASPGTLVGARVMLSLPLAGCILVASLVIHGRSVESLQVTTILVFGTMISAASLRWLLLARHAFGSAALCDLIAALVQFIGAAAVALAGLDAVAGLVVLVGGPILVALLTYATAALAGVVVRPKLNREAWRVLGLALPLGVAAIATAIYYSFDSLLIGLTRPSAELGIYAAAYRIVLAALIFPVIVHGVALPVIAKTVDADKVATAQVLQGLSCWMMIAALPAAAAVTLLTEPIVALLYGSEFAASAQPLSILIWSLVTVSAQMPFAVLLLATRRDRAYLGVTIVGAILNVVLNLFAIPIYGYMGAAATTVVSEVTVMALFVWLARPVSTGALRHSIPLGVLPAAVVSVLGLLSRGSLAAQLGLCVAGFAVSVVVLALTGAMREPLAMIRKGSS